MTYNVFSGTLNPTHFPETRTMSAARLTSGAEVTAVAQLVVTTDWMWSPADVVDPGDVVDAAAGEFDDEVMTSTDEDGIRRRCGRIDSGLPDIFVSEKHHAIDRKFVT